jgi:hypothetical protein
MTNTLTDDDFTVPPPPEQLDTVEWKATSKGDTIVGTLRRRTEVDTTFGRKTVLDFVGVTSLTGGGQPINVPDGHGVTLWPTPGALDAIDSAGIKVGDKCAMRLLELKDTGKGNPFKVFGAKHLGAGDVFAADKPAVDDDLDAF